MIKQDDFLVEIHTEELPPKSLYKLASAFRQQIKERLQKAELAFKDSHFFATPRRIAVYIKDLDAKQKDQVTLRKGPAMAAAYDKEGKPTKAVLGFAQSLQISPDELITIKNPQGEWLGFEQKLPGKSATELLPEIVNEALLALPMQKRMRWNDGDTEFVRPVHSVILLYGEQIIPATVLGCETGRVTRGHRFLADNVITIPHAASYASLLQTEGFVIADFVARKEKIQKQAKECVKKASSQAAVLISSEDLLDEVTGLVEWPTALFGQFEETFLQLPREVLISSMEDHQRYFPVINEQGQLLPYFVTASNIVSSDKERVTHGNERVLRARLSDAAFFYAEDKKETLHERIERLKGIVFQAKLGTLYDKAKRLSEISGFIAEKMAVNRELATHAGWLAKTDLTTQMVGEFPELQGVMGYYYALHDGQVKEVALAMKEHYLPRFAGDELPKNEISRVLALADRIDLLTGIFGINQIPTGDKDPFGLRRAALGIIRILIEDKKNPIDLNLQEVFEFAASSYQVPLENVNTVSDILNFIQERLRSYYQEQDVPADVFASVAALHIMNPYDMNKRIQAVRAFKKMVAAETLSIANKRVSNILAKYLDPIDAKNINPTLFETHAEKILAEQLEEKGKKVARLSQGGDYDQVLIQLAELKEPIDDFFDQVMVMTEDKARRENRILLLGKLRALFLKVADIALLQ